MTDTPPAASSGWDAQSRIASFRRWHVKGTAAGTELTGVLLNGADLRPGLEVLDLACGAGTPALEAARKVRPGGRVVGIDSAESVLDLARTFAQEEGLSNVEFRAASAEDLPFPGASFDRITCRFGAMYFSDLAAALRESRRALRPGGRLAWLVWGSIEQPFFDSTVAVALRHAGLRTFPPEALQPFCLAGGGVLGRAMRSSGFRDAREERHRPVWSWSGTPEEVCEFWFEGAPPFRGILDRLTPETRGAAAREITERLAVFSSDGVVAVPEDVILATGTRGPD